MIKARSGKNVILGLDAENVRRLKAGNHIRIKGKDVECQDDIWIIYGDTLEDVAREMGVTLARAPDRLQ